MLRSKLRSNFVSSSLDIKAGGLVEPIGIEPMT
jgi:hypothetical protein